MRLDFPKDLEDLEATTKKTRQPPRVLAAPLDLRLATSELKHLRSLRWQAGDPVWLLDGKGGIYSSCPAADGSLGACELVRQEKPNDRIVAIAFPDKPAFKECVRNAAAFGATEILFFSAQYSRSSGAKYSDKDCTRAEVWISETMKQAINPWRATVKFLDSLDETIAYLDTRHKKIVICDPRGDTNTTIAGHVPVVGPEGGWSAPELACIAQSSLPLVRFDLPVLTVPRAVCAALSAIAMGAPAS